MIFCKDNLKTLYSLLRHPRYLLRSNTRVIKSTFSGEKENALTFKDSWITDTSIVFQGTGNSIVGNDCQLFNSSVFIRGTGHRLVLEPGVNLYNVRLKIIGTNNVVHIGQCTRLGGGSIVHGGNGLTVSIGSDCFLAEGLDIWSTDTHTIMKKGEEDVCLNSPKSIHIGNHVWIGKDVAILKGVTIGDDAVVGMKSLVTKDIPEGSLNVGSPSRTIKTDITWKSWNPTNEDSH